MGNWWKGRSEVWDARIDAPFGSLTRMPLGVEDLFVHGGEGTSKWLMQPESTMERLLGTEVRGSVVFVTFSVYLVPSHAQLGLFLAEPHFFSAFVATFS